MAIASVNKTASGIVRGSPGMLCGAVLAAGSDVATLTVYDNGAAGSGTILLKLTAIANTSASVVFPDPVSASKGLWAVLTGTAENATVYFS